jgi:hypothetical protein
MRPLLCAVVLLLIAPLHAAEPDSLAAARKAIDECTPRLDAQADVGYDRIAVRCPNLAPALEQSGIEEWLPQGWKEVRNNLSAGSLIELRSLIGRELAAQPSERKPRVEKLNEVLAGLGDQHRATHGTWLRFKRWLRELLEQRDREDREDWFDRMVHRVGLPDAIVEVVTYISLGVMVALALIVVLNELRAAGLLGRRPQARADERDAGLAMSRPIPTVGEIERAPLVERPRMLLELIAAKLTAIRRLPPASAAMTVRELSGAVNLEAVQDREDLASLAATAERARYSESGVPADALESAYVRGRELLDSIEKLGAPEVSAGASS